MPGMDKMACRRRQRHLGTHNIGMSLDSMVYLYNARCGAARAGRKLNNSSRSIAIAMAAFGASSAGPRAGAA